ncbi:MAG: hypothetical protein A2Y08_02630 [Planctomycetes bacterium GWA2_40_7]|nr:MAG: hypothetical protein A2Y08_02630 [Planctomycetes bacterium GWA2_40_7]OHB47670.1 MAG: hypothetical protein A2106_04445 [Planctomycetes bacterium GWF2_40_8]OHC01488.1 MAG: hypothetical protein A3H23_00090 [Planctomycetes bacterium RIFCSPLOWO2_12_FULL_40_19]
MAQIFKIFFLSLLFSPKPLLFFQPQVITSVVTAGVLLTNATLETKCVRISTVFQILPLSLLFIQNLVELLVQFFIIVKTED